MEKTLGPEHPHVATALETLAGIDTALGKVEEAKHLQERAKSIRSQQL